MHTASLTRTIINKNFPRKDMVVYNAGDTSSENNPHNIPGPPESISTAQLLSPQAGYQVKPTDYLPLATPTRNPKHPRHDPSTRSQKGTWADEMDEDELFGQCNFNPSHSGTPHPYTHQTDSYPTLRAILLRSISKAKITAKNILMLTKSSSITESHIINEVLELLSVITGKPPASTFHNRTQPDKQILEILAKLTKKVDKLSEQVNEPRKRSSRITEPKEGLKASVREPLRGDLP